MKAVCGIKEPWRQKFTRFVKFLKIWFFVNFSFQLTKRGSEKSQEEKETAAILAQMTADGTAGHRREDLGVRCFDWFIKLLIDWLSDRQQTSRRWLHGRRRSRWPISVLVWQWSRAAETRSAIHTCVNQSITQLSINHRGYPRISPSSICRTRRSSANRQTMGRGVQFGRAEILLEYEYKR